MSKTTEEKIDEIHDNVLTLTMDFKAFKESCKVKHQTVEERAIKHDKVLFGNGAPGILARFDKLETKLIVWASVAIVVMQVLAPVVIKALGY